MTILSAPPAFELPDPPNQQLPRWLDYLAGQGWVVVVRGADQRAHYHLREDRRTEIQKLFPRKQ